MTGLNPGRLNRRVSLQRRVVVQDPETGAVSHTWEEVAKVWARIRPKSAREFVAAAAEQSQITADITIRYRADVSPTMRIVHGPLDSNDKPEEGAKVYNIQGVLADDESGLEWLTLPCSEGVTDGV